jgi:hypothetical protein
LYVSKERCLGIAASVGVHESVASSLLSLRDETALKDFKTLAKENSFFLPLLRFCLELMQDELHKFDKLGPMAERLVQKDLLSN